MAENDPTLYVLRNDHTQHFYIGATHTPRYRERLHLHDITTGTKPKLWQSMWNDHPQTRNASAWKFIVLGRFQTLEEAVQLESVMLQEHVGRPLCLNYMRTTGKGGCVSQEARDKISASQRGEGNHRHGKTAWNSGMTLSDDYKSKLRAAKIGKNNPMYGKTHSPETIAKIKATYARKRAEKEAAKSSR